MTNNLHINFDHFLKACSDNCVSDVISYIEQDINIKQRNAVALSTAASKGHLQTVKILLTHPRALREINLHQYLICHQTWINICMNNQIEIIEYLLFDEQLKEINNNIFFNSERLHEACLYSSLFGHIGVIDFLINDPRINNISRQYFNQDMCNTVLINAIDKGHFELMKYILNNDNLPIRADVSFRDNFALQLALYKEKNLMVRYLLSDQCLHSKCDIQSIQKVFPYSSDPCVKVNTILKNIFQKDEFSTFQSLIVEYGLIVNQEHKDWLSSVMNHEIHIDFNDYSYFKKFLDFIELIEKTDFYNKKDDFKKVKL